MNDADIIKALDEIACNENLKQISGIPHTAKCALDLINRQKAEILELQGNLKFVRGTVERLLELSHEQKAAIEELRKYKHDYYVLKAEAIKEFAERLKAKEAVHFCKCGQPFVYTDLFNGEIDNLAKEMTEETP